MNISIRKSLAPFGAIISVGLFLTVIVFLGLSNITNAASTHSDQNGRLITIHDRGTQKVILSKGATVGDAVHEAGITIDSNDTVEPALNQKLVASNYQVNIYRAHPVVIVDGNIRQKIVTPYQTADQIATSAGITLYPEDVTTITSVDSIESGPSLQMTVKRAVPFTFTLFGGTSLVRTQGKTVGEMLAEKGIKLTKDDHVAPDQNTKLTEGMDVKVWREGKQTITVDEPIAFDVQKIENSDMDISYLNIQTPGQAGSRNVTYQVTVQDGKEVSRVEIASLTTKQPVKQVEVVGVKGQYTTPSENETITWNYLVSNGYSRVQTAGIMGNLMQEHGFRTDGDGLAQWTGSRKAQLYSLPHPTNIYTQLGFLVGELNTNYASIGNAIKASTSLTQSVQIFQNQYERCGICAESARQQFASNILASF